MRNALFGPRRIMSTPRVRFRSQSSYRETSALPICPDLRNTVTIRAFVADTGDSQWY
jgi:hypothetical protein